jgi:hypothetical protein
MERASGPTSSQKAWETSPRQGAPGRASAWPARSAAAAVGDGGLGGQAALGQLPEAHGPGPGVAALLLT